MTFEDDLPPAAVPRSGQQPGVGFEQRDGVSDPRTGSGEHRLRDHHQPPQVEAFLRRVGDLIASARPMPLSSSVIINKDEVLELVEEAEARLPEELRAARWLLKEREDFLAKVRREGDEILEAARAKAERMVQRTEIVKSAEHRARHVIEGAEAEARRMRHECEDFCDQRLGSFEIVLDRTMKIVAAGREKLQGGGRLVPEPAQTADEVDATDAGFFDQDEV